MLSQLQPKSDTADLIEMVQTFPPFFFGVEDRFEFPKKYRSGTQYTFGNVSKTYLPWVVVKGLFDAYQKNRSCAQSTPCAKKNPKLDRAQVATLLEDYLPLLRELGVVNSSEPPDPIQASAYQRLRSANLFMTVSNGDEFFDFYEAIEFYLVSVGTAQVYKKVHHSLAERCEHNGEDALKRPRIDPTCFRKTFYSRETLKEFLGENLPQLVDQVAALNKENFELFVTQLESAASVNAHSPYAYNVSDIESIITLLFYIENIYKRFDTNLSGILEFTEAYSAFPVFCNELQKASSFAGDCTNEDGNGGLRALYGYLLFNQGPPDSPGPETSFWRKITQGSAWYYWRSKWSMMSKQSIDRDYSHPQITRPDMLTIISNLNK